MKYFGRMNDPKDLVTKEYVDNSLDELVSGERQYSGNPVVFMADAATMITDLTVSNIGPVQEGSGDPSPENVRPIIGFDSITVKRYGVTESDNLLTVNIPFGTTVFEGTLDVLSGLLTVTHKFNRFVGTENWGFYEPTKSATLSNALAGRYGNVSTTAVYGRCNMVPNSSSNVLVINTNILRATSSGSENLEIVGIDEHFGVSPSVSAWKDYLSENPLEILYLLDTPITYQLTPQQILTLVGQNTVSVDVGTLSVSIIRDPVTKRAIMPKVVTVALPLVGWNNKSQTVSVSPISGIEGTQLIQPVPASASKAAYEAGGVQASAEGVGTLTFTCDTVPESDLTVYVVVTELEVLA